jgi:CHAT domain-containing protein
MTGELGFLPIHAAGKYTDGKAVCASDFMVSSYIPTLAELAKARRDWQPISRTQLKALLLCETAGPGTGFSFLSKVRKEVDVVRGLFEAASARVASSPSAHTTIAEMDDMLKSTAAHILHLACHGIQDKEPLKSAFVLHDGKMSVQDLMRHSLPHAVLAFLSACETAKGHRDQPDEAVHLAASMLFCGFRSVVATMWCVVPVSPRGAWLRE